MKKVFLYATAQSNPGSPEHTESLDHKSIGPQGLVSIMNVGLCGTNRQVYFCIALIMCSDSFLLPHFIKDHKNAEGIGAPFLWGKDERASGMISLLHAVPEDFLAHKLPQISTFSIYSHLMLAWVEWELKLNIWEVLFIHIETINSMHLNRNRQSMVIMQTNKKYFTYLIKT